jgi:hypothetical protein
MCILSVYVVKLHYNSRCKKHKIELCSTDSQWFVSEIELYLTLRHLAQVWVKDSRDSVHGAVKGWKYKTSGMLHPRKPEPASHRSAILKFRMHFLIKKTG